jgi:ribosomal protein S14
MKKLLEKDKKRCLKINKIDKKHFILKYIFKNSNFFFLIRWNAFLKLKILAKNNSKVSITNRCLYTVNKKRFNKFTTFSRHVFLKLIRSGYVSGLQKANW